FLIFSKLIRLFYQNLHMVVTQFYNLIKKFEKHLISKTIIWRISKWIFYSEIQSLSPKIYYAYVSFSKMNYIRLQDTLLKLKHMLEKKIKLLTDLMANAHPK